MLIRNIPPNLLTALNLSAGIAGIINVFTGDAELTIWFIIIAGIFDFFDGFIARLVKSNPDFGKQFDSLADMVTFGVLPAIYLFQWSVTQGNPSWVNYSTILIAIFSAVRLAIFNIDTKQSHGFLGVPTPANSIMIATITQISWLTTQSELFVVGLTLFSSVMMVVRVPMIAMKFRDYSITGNWSRYLLVTGIIIGLILLKLDFGPYFIPYYIFLSLVAQMASATSK
ncbi:MAG: CDP-alcohol phosphatidyltransferase family protein [Cyclobacteriaceae bacterium]